MPVTNQTFPTPSPTTISLQRDLQAAAWKAGAMGALNVLSAVLASRLIVLIAVLGGIWLTATGLQTADPIRLVPLGIYSLFVVVPAVWLASRK